jgi:phenylacetate-CoA ligase
MPLEVVDAFRERLVTQWATYGGPQSVQSPPATMVQWVEGMRERSQIFREHVPTGMNLERDWAYVPTMSRADLAKRLVDVTPTDADLERLIVYDTTGTTGHAVHVPHHPQALAMSQALCERAPRPGPSRLALLGAMASR